MLCLIYYLFIISIIREHGSYCIFRVSPSLRVVIISNFWFSPAKKVYKNLTFSIYKIQNNLDMFTNLLFQNFMKFILI